MASPKSTVKYLPLDTQECNCSSTTYPIDILQHPSVLFDKEFCQYLILLCLWSHYLSLTWQLLLLASWHWCDLYLCFGKMNATLKDASVVLVFFFHHWQQKSSTLLQKVLFWACLGKTERSRSLKKKKHNMNSTMGLFQYWIKFYMEIFYILLV